MKNIDKTLLLFELMLTTNKENMAIVHQKVHQVISSREYRNVLGIAPGLSITATSEDIAQRIARIDICSIVSYQKALELEKEIIDLNRRIFSFTSINPYYSTGYEKAYGINRVGQIGVEINAEGTNLNTLIESKGISNTNIKKIAKLKAFSWYREAKKVIKESQEENKLMLRKIKKSKLSYGVLTFSFVLAFLCVFIMGGCFLMGGSFSTYRLALDTGNRSLLITLGIYASLFFLSLLSILHAFYRNYPLRLGSKVVGKVKKGDHLIQELDHVSDHFERYLVGNISKRKKINRFISELNILRYDPKNHVNKLIDYVYCEKEYYYKNHRFSLFLQNIFFIGVVITTVLVAVMAMV